MNLTEEQKTLVSGWAANGAGLSEIQSRLADELEMRLSYMETRFLILDLGAAIKDKAVEAKVEAKNDQDKESFEGEGEDADADEVEFVETPSEGAAQNGAGVSVEINPITRPGFALTGSVVFSDGVKAEWGFTNDGRFALEADDPAYKPSREDLQNFQLKLRELISKRGY